MSGGSHNYICFAIENELQGQMEDSELNDLINDLIELTHDLEWYHSDDCSEAAYRQSVAAFKTKWFHGDRNARLKGYIDERLSSCKKELYQMLGLER